MRERTRILLGWIGTPILLFLLVLTLLIWHPLIAISRHVHAGLHKWIIEAGNFLLVTHLRVNGGRVTSSWSDMVPEEGPVIILANHQSYFDIPIFIWTFRRYYAKFVAKRSLGRGLPSISYVLRTGGSALIDRKNAKQAIPSIEALGRYIIAHRCAACIFPEGTRAKDGVLKQFKPGGAKALLEAAPNVPVIPVAISGAWRLMRYNLKPVPFGVNIHVSVLPSLDRTGRSDDEIIALAEERIRTELTHQEN